MKQQVDKLIANTLLIEGEMYLPEVGTLILCRHAAKLISSKQLQSPHRELRLTKEQRGNSIIAHIMHVASVSTERANDIYAEWLAQSLRDGVLTIGLVCTIADGKVSTDEVFEDIANPEGNKITKIKPRKNRVARAMVAVVICGVLGATGYYLYISGVVDPVIAKLEQALATKAEVKQVESPITIEIELIVNDVDSTAVAVVEADSTNVVIDAINADSTSIAIAEPTTEPVVEQEVKQTPANEQIETPATSATEILQLQSRYSYAVWGVYRELKNAEDAIEWLANKFPTVDAHIYKYDERYMVAVYEVKSRKACGRQVSRWKAQWKSFKSVWVYTR